MVSLLNLLLAKCPALVTDATTCRARKGDGRRCTRRRRDDGCNYCGLHKDSQPNGTVDDGGGDGDGDDARGEGTQPPKETTRCVWVEEVAGVHLYLDADDNVYSPEDVVGEELNPRIIGHLSADRKCILHQVPIRLDESSSE